MSGIYELYIDTHFSAAHTLKDYPGECARLHGHNWLVRVYVRCRQLDALGIGLDLKVMKEKVKEALQELDHAHINDLPPFRDINPTSEHIARYLYRELGRRLNTDRVRVTKIKVSETPNAGVFYWEE